MLQQALTNSLKTKPKKKCQQRKEVKKTNKQKPVELIELKSTVIEVTTTATTGWIGSVGEKTEEDRIYEHEDKSIKFTQPKKQRNELDPPPPTQKIKNRISGICGTTKMKQHSYHQSCKMRRE